MFTSAEHADATYWPLEHTLQLFLFEGELQYDPSGHGLSTAVPCGHQLPAAHTIWDDGLAHTDPARHGTGAVARNGHQVPWGHGVCEEVLEQ